VSLELVLAAVGILSGLGGSLVAVIKSRPEARKLSADAAGVLVGIATGVSKELEADLKEMRQRVDELELVQRQQQWTLERHSLWDTAATEKLRVLGIEIGDPPPLFFKKA
jgi:hypothetical protein